MDIFTQAEELLTLDVNDPAFISSYRFIMENLANVKTSERDMKHATSLLQAIDFKLGGHNSKDIRETLKIFRIEYYTTTAKTMTNFIHRVGFRELLEARDICEKFIAMYCTTRDKNMYQPNNAYALQRATQLTNTFLVDYKNNSPLKWKSFNDLRNFVIMTATKGLLNIQAVPKIPLIIRKMDLEVINRTRESQRQLAESDVIKLDVFSDRKVKFNMEQFEIFDEEDISSRILYMYLAKPSELNLYMKNINKTLDNLVKEGKLTEDQRHYKFLHVDDFYASIAIPRKMEPYEPIEVLYLALNRGENGICLLQFTDAELNEALKFALYYTKNITKESLKNLALEDMKSRVAVDRQRYGEILPETKSDIKYNLDLISKYNILHSEDISSILEQLYREEY